MITRITLDNYMSHAKTVIEPAPGLTVIVGPNNCGKSAIVSALQTLCGDHDGDFMVRHGEKLCQVTVETDDGHSIAWRRKSKTVSYVLDGVDVHRVGRGNLPDNLHTLLRLPKVTHPNGDKQFDVHFGDQKSPIFLIDRESDAAAFFSTSSDAEKLIEMQRLHKEKARDARREHQRVTNDLVEIDRLLAALNPLDAIDTLLDEAEETERDLLADDQAAESLRLLIEQLEKQQTVVTFHANHARAIAPLTPPPDQTDLAPLQALIDNLTRTSAQLHRLSELTTALAPLTDPPELADDRALDTLCNQVARLQSSITRFTARRHALAALVEPEPPIDTQPIIECAIRLRDARKLHDQAAAQRAALQSLVEPPPIEDLAPLTDLLDRLSRAANLTGQYRRAAADHARQLQSLDDDMNTWLAANPTCPTCGAQTSRDTLLTHGGAHHE
jgi:exonuclease SbcC